MVLVIVGMIVGLLSGMFGIGGGTVIVPALVWLGLSQRHAAATSMLAIVPTSISGVISYAHNGNVDWVAAALLSNAQSCYARAELEMTGLAGVLDDVIISSEEKIRKPARDLYMLALAPRALTACISARRFRRQMIRKRRAMRCVRLPAPIMRDCWITC